MEDTDYQTIAYYTVNEPEIMLIKHVYVKSIDKTLTWDEYSKKFKDKKSDKWDDRYFDAHNEFIDMGLTHATIKDFRRNNKIIDELIFTPNDDFNWRDNHWYYKDSDVFLIDILYKVDNQYKCEYGLCICETKRVQLIKTETLTNLLDIVAIYKTSGLIDEKNQFTIRLIEEY